MCGICGLIDGRGVRREDLKRMTDTLSYRGPDDDGFYLDEMAGLGHRRLSIIDLNGGHQPISNEDGSIWIVFNGEIYNYQDLRPRLEANHRFATNSDTEVIVHLYEEMGELCVKELRGMFAFAIWDRRDNSLFIARDHLGQKPMFYTQQPGWFGFASEIKALLAVDPSLRQVDPKGLHQYLTLRIIAPPLTMFTGIRKLPPGHTLTFKNGQVRVTRYWDLQYEPKYQMDEAEILDELERRVLEAVRYHMVSDVPVGAFLSGGMDSSIIVGMMSKLSKQPIKTFSVGVPYGSYSELPYARMVAEKYKTQHFEESIFPSLIRVLPELVWHLDEPSDPLSAPMYYISRMARREVKVVLGGDGGDELFGGYDRYYGNRYVDYYALLPHAFRKYFVGQLLHAMPDGFWYKSLSHKLKWMNQMSFDQGGRRYARSLSYFYFNEELRANLYGDRLKTSLGAFDPEESIYSYFDCKNAVELVDKMLYADSMVRLPDHSVMILDRTSMAHGLEARAPFMDHKLAEFVARIPASLKVHGRTLRYIQARLAERYLPPELLHRKKQGFSSPLPYLLADEFRRLFAVFLSDSHLVRDGYLKDAPIRNLLAEHLGSKVDHGNRLWLLCNSEIWYRMEIEGWTRDAVK
ncbi:MAG TPA: asparagine synthase (glutamine-hydrolyzing), partial [Anaerolineales bacterium]